MPCGKLFSCTSLRARRWKPALGVPECGNCIRTCPLPFPTLSPRNYKKSEPSFPGKPWARRFAEPRLFSFLLAHLENMHEAHFFREIMDDEQVRSRSVQKTHQ